MRWYFANLVSKPMRLLLASAAAAVLIAGAVSAARVHRVRAGLQEIPVMTVGQAGPTYTRYWPRLLAWDDRSSARVDRMVAMPSGTTLLQLARSATASLVERGWYLVTPLPLGAQGDPQVVVWQRDPDERLDLTQLWPVAGMRPEQRLYGGRFPAAFLDKPVVIEWTWSLGGPRSARPDAAGERSIVRHPDSSARSVLSN